MRWFAVAVVACACAYACSFRANNSNGKQDSKLDTIVLNEAGACQTVSSGCSGDMLITCTTVGGTPSTATCAWGCSDTPAPHCGKLQPTGNGVVPTDLDQDSTLADVTLSGTINGDSGQISGGFTRAGGAGVIAGVDYQVRNGIAIFRFNSVHVTGKLSLAGGSPIALVANGPITIDALIDAQGACTGANAVAGGAAGGATSTSASGAGSGAGGAGMSNQASGGGGGGNGSAGGGGGSGNGGHNRTAGGAAFDSLAMLAGGGGGGGGGGLMGNGGTGGGGGGALQLASNASVIINATGAINAGGCGGKVGGDGASGGGAGGTLLFEGVVVHVAAGGQLAVNGGGGGGGDTNGKAGSNAQLGTSRALGGTPDNMGGVGGHGGASGFLGGEAGSDAPNGGGGGGGVGRIRFETRAGSATIDLGAVLSPSLTETGTTTTQTTALVK